MSSGGGKGGGGSTTQTVTQQLSPEQQQYLTMRNNLLSMYLQPFAQYMYGGQAAVPQGGMGFGQAPKPPAPGPAQAPQQGPGGMPPGIDPNTLLSFMGSTGSNSSGGGA